MTPMSYFTPSTDLDAFVARFTEDAVVTDDGRVHRGADAVRAWHAEIPPVTYAVRSVDAVVEVAGEFPGSPVTLSFRFTHATDGRISDLRIEPVRPPERA